MGQASLDPSVIAVPFLCTVETRRLEVVEVARSSLEMFEVFLLVLWTLDGCC